MSIHNRKIIVRQHDITDCGAACLASVCAYYGHQYPIARIRQLAHTDRHGTNILGMIEAAGKLGFTAKGVRAQFEAFKVIPIPTIAHVVVKDTLHHFVVVYKVADRYLVIMDPGTGKLEKITLDEFKKIWTGVLIIMSPMASFVKGNDKIGVIKRLIQLVSPHRSMLFQALLGSVVCSILGLSTSVYIGKITDYVLVDGNINLLNLLSIAMISIVFLRGFINAVRSIISARTGQLINASLIIGYYNHILRLPQQFYDTMRVGEIISRINDASKITNFINDTAANLVVSILTLLFTIGFMMTYSLRLTIVTLASAPLFALIYFIYNRLNRKYQRCIMEKGADLESQLVESLNGIGTIKRFGVEDFANMKTENCFVRLMKDIFTSISNSVYVGSSMDLITSLLTIVVLWYGSSLVLDKSLTPGALIIFYSLLGYVTQPVLLLINSNRIIQDAAIAVDRLFQIMDLAIEPTEENQIELTKDMLGDICFEGVWFRYGSRKQVFRNLNLLFEMGRTTAVVGESGSGKTTLGSLLQHLYPLEKGRITIGGYDIKQISNRSLRCTICTVPQRIELFAGSVIENIAIGDFNPDMRRILDLISLLELRSFIDSLPDGLHTRIGEQGASLSGGESQRIAIARALYRNPDILILDEATSSLDSISENAVKRALDVLRKKGMTIIVIAHRLSTVKDADHIIVMADGKVEEQGGHAELLALKGVYSKLWKEQGV